MAMKSVPFLQERLSCFLYKKRFDITIGEVSTQLLLLENALKSLRESKNLKRVLELVLAMGNYMNGGSAKGGASGFKLDTLSKLRGTKSTTDPQNTLLHFLVTSLKTTQPSVHEGLKIDLAAVHAAARTEMSAVLTEVNKLQTASRKLRKSLDAAAPNAAGGASSSNSSDKFYKIMSEFYDRSNILVGSVGDRAKKIEKGSVETVKLFAEENTKGASLDTLIVLFDQFIDEYNKAEQEITQRAEQAEKQKKSELEKEKRQREQEEKKIRAVASTPTAAGADQSKVVDATLTALSSANASDLAAAVRAKRAAAGEKISAHRTNQQQQQQSTLKSGDKSPQIQQMPQAGSSGKFPSLNRFGGTKIM